MPPIAYRWIRLAVQFGCESLEQAAVAFKLFKLQNFVSVVRSEDFKEFGFEKIKELVSHDEIIVSKEEYVYEAVVSWVKHDLLSRECLFPELLKCLRLFSMSKYSLWEILKEELVIKSNTRISILQEGMAFFLLLDNFLGVSLKPRACLNSNEAVIILTCGHNGIDLSQQEAINSTEGFLLFKNLWLSLPITPFPRTRHAWGCSVLMMMIMMSILLMMMMMMIMIVAVIVMMRITVLIMPMTMLESKQNFC